MVEVTRAVCALLAVVFHLRANACTVASPGRTSLRTNVPHFFTCTGCVFTSQTCR